MRFSSLFSGFSCLAQAAVPSGLVGVKAIMTNNAMWSDPVAVSIWYPADKAGATTMIGGNAVFDGVSAIPDAIIPDGKIPRDVTDPDILRHQAELLRQLGATPAELNRAEGAL